MPIAATIAATAVSAGTAIYSANQQKKAAGDALNAQTAANDKSLAAQQAALDRITQLESPFQQGGALGMAALLERLGLTRNGTPTGSQAPDPYYGYESMTGGRTPTPTTTAPQPPAGGYTDSHVIVDPMAPPKGGATALPVSLEHSGGATNATTAAPAAAQAQGAPDWNAYLQANPDVMQWAQAGGGDPNIPIDQQSLQQRAAYQWAHEQQVYGTPPRQLTYLPAQSGNDNTATQTPQGPQAPDLMNAPRPAPGTAPTFQRPDTGADPTFGPAPSQSQYFDPSLFKTDPGYQFRVDQALRGVNANFGARGLLKSGSAAGAITQRASDLADQGYNDWFNRQNSLYSQALGQYNTDRSFGQNVFNADRANANQNFENDRSYGTNLFLNNRDFNNNNFTNDRNYQAGRYDTATGNLFSLAQIGQNAAGAVGGAGQNYANNASNIYGSQANAASTAAAQRAQANAGMVGSIGGAVGNFFNSYSGFQTPIGAPRTVGDAYPTITGSTVQTNVPGMTTFNPPVF